VTIPTVKNDAIFISDTPGRCVIIAPFLLDKIAPCQSNERLPVRVGWDCEMVLGQFFL